MKKLIISSLVAAIVFILVYNLFSYDFDYNEKGGILKFLQENIWKNSAMFLGMFLANFLYSYHKYKKSIQTK